MKKSSSATSNSIATRLAAYSATATAAILLAPSAQADVITNITASGSFTLSYPGSGVVKGSTFAAGIATDLYFWGKFGSVNQIGMAGAQGGHDFVAAAFPATNAYPFLAKFGLSTQIQGRNPADFIQGNGAGHAGPAFSTSGAGAHKYGSFIPAGVGTAAVGYMGFKHVANGHNYYGWLRIQVTENASGQPLSISLKPDGDGFVGAYDATPDGTLITAGETAAIPEPATVAMGLGLLALGAVGVRELRRRTASAA